MEEKILMIALGVLLVLAAFLKLQLEKKKGTPFPLIWQIQIMVFPTIYFIALMLYLLDIADLIIPAILPGILEEIIFFAVRKRQQRKD